MIVTFLVIVKITENLAMAVTGLEEIIEVPD